MLSSGERNDEDTCGHIQDQVAHPKDQDENYPSHDTAVIVAHDVGPFEKFESQFGS